APQREARRLPALWALPHGRSGGRGDPRSGRIPGGPVKVRAAAGVLFVGVLASASAPAPGVPAIGQGITPAAETAIRLDGYFRLRGEMLHDLDLNRGLTPSGQPIFPQPTSDPSGHTLFGGDMRLRTDLAVYAPGGGVAVKAR